MISTDLVFIEVLICIFINVYLVKSIWKIRLIDVNQLNLVTQRYKELYSLQIGDIPKLTKPFLEHINSLEQLLDKVHKYHPEDSEEKKVLLKIYADLQDLKSKIGDPLTFIETHFKSIPNVVEK